MIIALGVMIREQGGKRNTEMIPTDVRLQSRVGLLSEPHFDKKPTQN